MNFCIYVFVSYVIFSWIKPCFCFYFVRIKSVSIVLLQSHLSVYVILIAASNMHELKKRKERYRPAFHLIVLSSRSVLSVMLKRSSLFDYHTLLQLLLCYKKRIMQATSISESIREKLHRIWCVYSGLIVWTFCQ